MISRWKWWLASVGLVLIVVWSYFPSLAMLAGRWWSEDDYQHCFFVPLVSLALLWYRRDILLSRRAVGSWWGVPVLLLAGGLRCLSYYGPFPLLDGMSLPVCLFGLVGLMGGATAIRWAWPAVLFLGFMVPLPGAVAGALSHPLQRIATIGSEYFLQTIGVPAVAQGNVIWLTDGKIGVAEACSGLRMLNLFVAMCLAASFFIQRPFWEKILIVGSSAPIGIATNVLRITVTGVLYEYAGAELAERVFHDLAGLLMMPTALALLGIEMYLLSKLLLDPPDEDVLAMNLRSGGGESASRASEKHKKRQPQTS